MKKHTLMAAAMACLMLTGCGGEEGEVKKAVVAELEKPLCMEVGRSIPFSITIANPFAGAPHKEWVDVLVKEGLLEQTGTQDQRVGAFAVTQGTYDVTSKGKKIQKDNTLCYGKTKVLKLLDYSKPQAEGSPYSQARVQVKHEITESWAKNPLFEDRVESGEDTVSVTLVKTNKGWRAP